MIQEGQHPLLLVNAMWASLAVGIAAAEYLGIGAVPMAAGGVIVGIAALILVIRRSRLAVVFAALMFFFMGASRFMMVDTLPQTDISRLHGETVRVSGTVQEAPHISRGRDGSRSMRLLVEARHIVRGRDKVPVSGKLYIYTYVPEGRELPDVRIGDHAQADGKVLLISGYGNPGRINTVRMARAKGITARLNAGKSGVSVERADELSFLRWSESVRQHYRGLMEDAMPPEDAAAVFAMLFGGYDGISPELLESFTATGIVHILSVSGSHITLLAAFVSMIGALLCLRKWVTACLVILVIVVYGVLSGCVPPALRAGVMGGLAYIAIASGRNSDARYLLGLSGIAMLLVSPFLLFDVSFELSFAATAGLLYLSPIIAAKLSFLPRWIAGALSVTIAAQLFSLPVMAWYFHQVSVSALAANLLAVPLLEFIIVLGLMAGLIGMLVPFIGKLVFLLDSLILGLAFDITRLLMRLPGSQLFVPTMGPVMSAAWYAVLGAAALSDEMRGRLYALVRRRAKVLAAAMVLAAAFSFGWYMTRPAELAMHFIDVGQGDACLLVTPHGRAVMFDTGGTDGYDIGTRVDVPYLLHYGVRSLDMICLTHAHMDHAGGAGGIVGMMPVGTIMTGHEPREEYLSNMKLSESTASMQHFVTAERGSRMSIDGVTVEVLYAPEVSGGSGNEASVVYRVSYGRASFLITGDLEQPQEEKLLSSGVDIHAKVLKVGHHGSDTSSSETFLSAISPRYAVISVGRDNRFGHPKAKTLEKLEAAGIDVYRTDEDGAVVFYTDGKHIRMESFYKH